MFSSLTKQQNVTLRQGWGGPSVDCALQECLWVSATTCLDLRASCSLSVNVS